MDVALLTTSQVANRLGVDRRTVLRMAHRRTLTPVYRAEGRTGGHLFAASDVDAYLAARAGGDAA